MKNQLTVNWTEDELPRFIEEWFGPLTYLKSPERQATPSALSFSLCLSNQKPKIKIWIKSYYFCTFFRLSNLLSKILATKFRNGNLKIEPFKRKRKKIHHIVEIMNQKL